MKHIFNFGSPRSGTTYFRRVLEGLKGVSAHKLSEGNPCHPSQSNNGLFHLAKMFHPAENVLFVRTVRNVEDIIKSFYMLRQPEYNRVQFIKDDTRMMRFIIDEENNFNEQYADKEKWSANFLCINYDRFESGFKKAAAIDQIITFIGNDSVHVRFNEKLLIEWFHKFKTKSISLGRLGEGKLNQEVIKPDHLASLVAKFRNETGKK